jgi:hypothetical protein
MLKNYFRFNNQLPFFIFAIALILLRNFKALTVPSLYAEDAMWISKIIFNGFLDTALHARDGFPVFNLVFLDYLAFFTNKFVFNSFLDLPYSILIISTLFYAFIAALPFCILKRGYTFFDKVFLSFFTLFIPIGYSGSEVFGKIGNLVFLFPVLSTYIILSYKNNKSSLNFYLVSAVLFFNSITFPVCLLILIFFLFYLILIDLSDKFFNYKTKIINFHQCLKVSSLIFLILFTLYLYPNDLLSNKGGANLPVNINGLIDMGFSRMILYPFIVSFYGVMNDLFSVIFFLLVLFFIARKIASKTIINFLKSDAFIFFSGFLIFFLSTIIMRAGFSSWFGEYNNTFPDRYFYAINILFLQFLYILFKDNNYIRKILLLTFFVNVIIFSSKIIEINKTNYNYEKYGSFKQMFCNMEKNKIPEFIEKNQGNVDIPIYPVDHQFIWKFTIPLQDYNAMKLRCIS